MQKVVGSNPIIRSSFSRSTPYLDALVYSSRAEKPRPADHPE
jgi:hypothetical protein